MRRFAGATLAAGFAISALVPLAILAGRVRRADLTGGNGQDCIPHGTIVASIIAASDARARGIPFYGVAPAAHILSIRVQQQEATTGLTDAQRRRTLANIANGIRYA